MKMLRLFSKRSLAVAASLALCASLVAPAFAANFSDLQHAVNGSDGSYGENGAIIRNGNTITLNEKVEREGNEGYVGIHTGNNIVIDLNGQTIDGGTGNNNASVFSVDGGSLTIKDGSDVQTGTITGGNALNGGGVNISNGGSVTLESGTITGNTATSVGQGAGGGGVYVTGPNSSFAMTGGTISGNNAESGNAAGPGDGGGVAVRDGASFTMNGGFITDNTAGAGGGGVYVYGSGSSFTMNGGEISDNSSQGKNSAGGGVFVRENGSFTMNSGFIGNNTIQSTMGEDVSVTTNGSFTMNGDSSVAGTIYAGNGVGINGEDHDRNSTGDVFEFKAEGGASLGTTVTGTNSNVTTGYAPAVPELPGDDNEEEIEIPDVTPPLAGLPDLGDEIELEDEAIPLAGLLTRGDVIGYLWQQSGSPDADLSDFEDVPGDHEWATAIGWAQANGIAAADLEGNFRPDDLILRSVEDIALNPEGELEQFLNRYAVYAGVELNADELFVELEGDWDDIIMGEDAQVIFDDFFAKLELALAA